MKILITTGIYPPKIGGPAQYSKNLENELRVKGHDVSVSTFSIENYLPTGIRHIYFFVKTLPRFVFSDFIISLDTYSVGFPSVFVSKVLNKKIIIRTGGDFLWEHYVERTGKKVLLRNFYDTEKGNFTFKERIIFRVTKWTLLNVSKLVFSTTWQRDIFVKAYGLNPERIDIIENFYGEKESDIDSTDKIFIASTRNLVWKNLDVVRKVFDKIKASYPDVALYQENVPFNSLMNIMARSYAVVLVSLGDISPNMIMDAIRLNRPFICTKEVGIYDRIKEVGIFVDPLNEVEIEKAILEILNKDGYEKAKERVRSFDFKHSWGQIADEFLSIYRTIK